MRKESIIEEKYIVYYGDTYYPYRDEFDSLEEALKAYERDMLERNVDESYWHGTYLCKIIKYRKPKKEDDTGWEVND